MILLCIITVLISIWKITNKETTEAFMAAPIDRISQIPKKEPTLLSMLKTATKPMGSTMYVYGGGWNEADTGAGKEAVSIGCSPEWNTFYQLQDQNYDINVSSYQIHEGLDCSGYIGWILYNTFHTLDGEEGYVMKGEDMARVFSQKGWGTYIPKSQVKTISPEIS